ncbi:MAG: hypothetical protein ACQEWV_18920 [Bacillota bacterium]
MELRRLSRRHNLKIRDTTIQRLLYAAEFSLSFSKKELAPELLILNMKIQDLKNSMKTFLLWKKNWKYFLSKQMVSFIIIPKIGVKSQLNFIVR